MFIPTIGQQIAAQDLRYLEVRAREEERIAAVNALRAGKTGRARFLRRLLAALSRGLHPHEPQAAVPVAAPLETGAR
jgi:hypothetical protein